MDKKIWFHADDFGVTPAQSEKILACHADGVLNSVSILPNVPDLAGALGVLDRADPDGSRIRRVLHLNFVEGRPLAGAENVPLLTDRTGYLDKSFIQYFKWDLVKRGAARRKLMHQIKLEIAAQIRAVTAVHDFRITAVDSHQHYHMIPIIFDSLMEVLADQEFAHLGIRYIRAACDPLLPLLRDARMLRSVPVINWVKWCILRVYAGRVRRIAKRCGMGAPVFFGIFFTCQMRYEVVRALLPGYRAYAAGKNEELELMFHPGGLETAGELLDGRDKELERFYLSKDRSDEAGCLRRLRTGSR